MVYLIADITRRGVQAAAIARNPETWKRKRTMKTEILDGAGRPTAYGFSCGCVERFGEYVSISREHGAFIVCRAPNSPHGWRREGRRTIGAARKLARAYAAAPIVEIQPNGDPYGRGFTATETHDGGESWFYRGDIGAQPREWWRRHCRLTGKRLRLAN